MVSRRSSRARVATTVLAALAVTVPVAATASPSAAVQSERGPHAAEELLVRFDPSTSPSARRGVRERHGLEEVRALPLPGVELVRAPGGTPVDLARAVRAEGAVRHVQPNHVWTAAETAPSDRGLTELWGLNNTGQATGPLRIPGTPDADIDAPEAWRVTSGSEELVVAVIDTGVAIDHPDLAETMWTNEAEAAGTTGVDDDSNGYVDDVHGWDFVNDDASVSGDGDPSDHGTHVAGTIAGVWNNGIGVAGVSQARIMTLKFLGPGGGTTAAVIEALDYAVDMGADVINASWGGTAPDPLLRDKIAEVGAAGLLFVAAAGNGATDVDTYPYYPSSFDLDNIVSVAATDRDDLLADFSNHGARNVDVGAPGVEIYSTVPGDRYTWANGTSMAVPHVTGAAAQVLAAYPRIGHLDVRERLVNRGDRLPALDGRTASGRRLDLAGALDTPGDTLVGVTAAPEVRDGSTRIVIDWRQQEPLDVTVSIADGSARRVRRADLGARPADQQRWVWDATADDGAPVADGLYTVTVAGVDARGGAVSDTTDVTLPAGEPLPPGDVPPVDGPEGDDRTGGSRRVINALGGERALAPSTLDQVEAITGATASRLAGADRFATAAATVAAAFPASVDTVYLATGEDFPDALAGSAAAAEVGAPVLLVARDALPEPTAEQLRRLAPRTVKVLGGPAAVSDAVVRAVEDLTGADVRRLAGPDRYATAAAVVADAFADPTSTVYVATGADFPDALAGSAAAARVGAPVLLVERDAVPGTAADQLRRLDPADVRVLGGTAAIADATVATIGSLTGATVTRLAGPDRFATAAAVVADAFPGTADVAYLATGSAFPDALAGSAAAGAAGVPVLLAGRDAVPDPIAVELRRLFQP